MRRNPQTVWCAVLVAACLLAPSTRAAGADAFADRLQACAFSHPVTDFPRLADLPPPVLARVALSIGLMADKGEKFNASDVIILDPSSKRPALPSTRFMRAGQWQNLVFVWYEAGGIALFQRLALFRLDADGKAAKLSDQLGSGQDPCALTDSTLDAGKSPPR